MDVRHFRFLAAQPSARLKPRERFLGLPKRGLAFLLANVMLWQPIWADAAGGIAVSGGTTSVGQAGNGVPVINIAAPNASGLSHNQFSDYNVGTGGVILNNATGPTQSTQLGGIIVGNSNLNGHAASTILNEVNGGSPSQLKGFTEVAGQSAHVIVANPYGITCDGCGFINAPRVTLSTGKAVLDASGKIDHFQVDDGSVSIEGAGLNASNLDQFDIVTRSAKLNADIYAKKLNIITGANDVAADSLAATPRTPTGTAPALSIDSAALGGMYANTIKLVGTEQGVGVKVAGNMAASAGDIQIDVNGHLSLAQTAASGAITANAQGIDTQGPVYAGTQLTLNSSAQLVNAQSLSAKDAVTVTATQLTNTGFIEAGVNPDNTRNTTGDLTVNAQNLSNGGSLIASRDLSITASQAVDNVTGGISAQRGLTVNAQSLDNRAGLLSSGGNLSLTSTTLNNSVAGVIDSDGQLSVTATDINNSNGSIAALQAVDLHATSLDNTLGSLLSNAAVSVALTGSLTNLQGKLASGGALTVQADTVNNQAGQLASQQTLSLSAGGLDNSASGTVVANGKLTVTAANAVNNSNDGLIYSQAGAIDLHAASLNNTSGTVQSQNNLGVTLTGDLTNVTGTLLAQLGDLDLNAANANNQGGVIGSSSGALHATVSGLLDNSANGLLQGQALTINALTLTNDGGQIAALGTDATVTASTVSNTNGAVLAKQALSVTADSVSNHGGQVSADTIGFALTGTLDNTTGLIEAGNTLSVTAAALTNQNGQLRSLGTGNVTSLFNVTGALDNTNGQVATNNSNLTVNAQSLQNVGGSVLHLGTGTLAIGLPLLQNAGGSLVTNGDLTFSGSTWNNSTAVQAANLTVNVDTLNQSSSGQLVAGHFSGQGTNWTNEGLISSDTSLDLTLTGNYASDAGKLISLSALSISAAGLNLGSTSRVAGGADTTITTSGQLLNQGQLTSDAGLLVTAASIDNQGTLGSAGDLRLVAPTISNQGGLIFSGGNMELRTQDFTNRLADVYSKGFLTLAADDAGTLANSISNLSGSMESGGDMDLRATTITNSRDVLDVKDFGLYSAEITSLPCGASVYATDCDGKKNHVWQVTELDKLEVLNSTAAAQITADANLTLVADQLTNSSSVISAGGNVVASVTDFSNQGVETGETETDRVIVTHRTRDVSPWADAATAFNAKYWDQNPGYVDDPQGLAQAYANFLNINVTSDASDNAPVDDTSQTKTTQLGADSQTYAGIIQAGGNVSIQATNTLASSVIRPSYSFIAGGNIVGDTSTTPSVTTRVQLNAQLPPDLAQQQVNPTTLPGFSLPTGQNGLFHVNPPDSQAQGVTVAGGKPAPHYLIETNPALTNLKQFMSSSYMLNLLGYSPDQSYTLLGDGLYEERLIDQAIEARTGQRFIDGLTSDDATFKYLMDNAIASKDALNLQLGVSLTADQVAALTHDIVWMEDQVVDGQHVLVPVLYLAQANNRLAPNGALIQGQDVTLISGNNLTNAGTLRASNNLAAYSGNNLLNTGLIEAGNRTDLLATNSLVNSNGGIIKGKDVTLTATNGDVTNLTSTTTHNSARGPATWTRTFVDSAASVEAGNSLTIKAGHDVNNSGVLKSGGDLSIAAGNDVNVASVENVSGQTTGTKHTNKQITQVAADVSAGGNLTITAANDVKVTASNVTSTGDMTLAAGHDITVQSAADERHSYFKNSHKTVQNDSVTQVGSSLNAGGDLTAQAGQDLTFTASSGTAGKEAYLYAGQNLTVQSAENSTYSLLDKKKKSSSLFSSSSKSTHDETSKITNAGSIITGGTQATLIAGNDLLVKASTVQTTTGPVELVAGRDVNIVQATDTETQSHLRKTSNSSFGGLKGSKVKDQGTETKTTSAGSLISGDTVTVESDRDITVTASSVASSGDLALQAGRNLTINAAENTDSRSQSHKEKSHDFSGALTGDDLGMDNVTGDMHMSLGSQSQTSQSDKTTLAGSTVGSAYGNVSLVASNAVNVVASDLVSKKDMTIVGSDVSIVAGTETDKETTSDKSSSLGIGRVIGGMVVDTFEEIKGDINSVENSNDGRLKAVKGAQALLALNDSGNISSALSSALAKKPNTSGSVIKIGSELADTHSKETTEYDSQSAKQSTVTSGGNLSIDATGNAPGSTGNIYVAGSGITAANTALIAKNDITLESTQNISNWDSHSSHSKTSIGASFNIGSQNGFTLDLGAQIALSMGTGSELVQVNTTIDTGVLVLQSGKDTTLAGAQVRAGLIQAIVGGDLNIASSQDTETQKNKQASAGVGASICIPPFCLGETVTANGNISASNMKSNYKDVVDQTGLYAGAGGYNITVGQTTRLQGGVIASTANALLNSLNTDRLITSDIKNVSDIKSQSAGLSYSYGSGYKSPIANSTPLDPHSTAGGSIPLSLEEDDHTTTHAAVSDGSITVRNAAGSNDLVGLDRDTKDANKALNKPDTEAMQERLDLIQSSVDLAKTAITDVANAKLKAAQDLSKDPSASEADRQAATNDAESWSLGGDNRVLADVAAGFIAAGLGGAGASTTVGIVANTSSADTYKLIGDYANEQVRIALSNKDSATAAEWAEGGEARVLLHTLAGALQGLSGGDALAGALGAGASAAAMPLIEQALDGSGLSDVNKNALSTLIVAGLGASVSSGGATLGQFNATTNAVEVDAYNRQLHADEARFIDEEARKWAADGTISEADAASKMAMALAYYLDSGWQKSIGGTPAQFDPETLSHLSTALQPVAASYDSPNSDVGSYSPGSDSKVYTTDDTLSLIENYQNANPKAFNDYTSGIIGLGNGTDPDSIYLTNFYKQNLTLSTNAQGNGVQPSIKGAVVGGLDSFGSALKGTLSLTNDLLSGNGTKLSQELGDALDPQLIASNYSLDLKESEDFVTDLQKNDYAVYKRDSEAATDLGLTLVTAGEGALGKAGALSGEGATVSGDLVATKTLVTEDASGSNGTTAEVNTPSTTTKADAQDTGPGPETSGNDGDASVEPWSSQSPDAAGTDGEMGIANADLEAGRAIPEDEAAQSTYRPCCFVAGTLVATPDGDQAIEKLKVGDKVWSKPQDGGAQFAAKILATHIRTDQPIYKLDLEGLDRDGKRVSDTLYVTAGHPFYVAAEHGFVPVIRLKPGDQLQSLGDGAKQDGVIKVVANKLYQPQGMTYNLTVDIGHTFYVGKLRTWVHNTGNCYSCSNGSCSIHQVPEVAAGDNGGPSGTAANTDSQGVSGAKDAQSAAGAPKAEEPLDWSRLNPKGESAVDHVNLHGADNLGKPIQGVFAGDPIAITEEAWTNAQATGIKPVVQNNGNLVYDVPMGKPVGWQGGSNGTGAALSTVRIVTNSAGQVVTAFPK